MKFPLNFFPSILHQLITLEAKYPRCNRPHSEEDLKVIRATLKKLREELLDRYVTVVRPKRLTLAYEYRWGTEEALKYLTEMDRIELDVYPEPTAEATVVSASEKQTFQIWCEGYSATGQNDTARLLGCSEGTTFREACERFVEDLKANPKAPYTPSYFNTEDLTYWGCRLFDNEADARKRFG